MTKSCVHGWPSKRAPEHGAVFGPAVVGVGRGVDAEDTQPATAPGVVGRLLLLLGPWGFADGEEGQDAGGGKCVGGDVTDVADDDGGEPGQASELAQAGDGLSQDSVHPCWSIGVGGHLRHDQHVVRHVEGV